MRISFYSFSDDEKVHFEAEGTIIDNVISFYDNTNVHTQYIIDKINNTIKINRTGSIKSSMFFEEGKINNSLYESSEGLNLEFLVHCKSVSIEKNKIMIEYSLILDENILNNYKIWLLIH